MAVIASVAVVPATEDDHARVEKAVEVGLQRLGHPPDGLMVHLGYPVDDGFVIIEAWRTEDLFRAYMADILGPAFDEAGVVPGEPAIIPAWSIARP